MGEGSIPACAGEPGTSATTTPAPWVYPRVCGGTSSSGKLFWPRPGLSPRVRGNPGGQSGWRVGVGSIPACAGEPRFRLALQRRHQVYPRVCGGTHVRTFAEPFRQGLSPRVRGNLDVNEAKELPRGSIPACAGEPAAGGRRGAGNRVYPRVCGGTRPSRFLAPPVSGLSPRVRGNPPQRQRRGQPTRSIPACAGEPDFLGLGFGLSAVYPRVCGGTAGAAIDIAERQGLSPRVRGNLPVAPKILGWLRSIPACAGEPDPPAQPRDAAGVYPRVCGGTPRQGRWYALKAGLSPRVRGNRAQAFDLPRRFRSIPACAGEPILMIAIPTPLRVYPRVCGGTRRAPHLARRAGGLSPRVRGNRNHACSSALCCRSIPACAGEPLLRLLMPQPLPVYPRVCGGTRAVGICWACVKGLSPRVRGNR